MSRSLRIPGLVDLIQADVRSDIRGLADDARLDRSFDPRGPLINRILVQRIRSVLRIDGMPLPSVAPRGDAQRLRAQDILRRPVDIFRNSRRPRTFAAPPGRLGDARGCG